MGLDDDKHFVKALDVFTKTVVSETKVSIPHKFTRAPRCPKCGELLESRGDEEYRDGLHDVYYCIKCDKYRVLGLVLYDGNKDKLPGA